MNETGLATRTEQSLAPAASEWQTMRDQAAVMVASGFLPSGVKTPEQALAIMMTGRELNLPPMAALRGITVIQGTPSMKPELMLGLCIGRVPGFRYAFGVCDSQSASVTVSRPSMLEPFTSVFTMRDAETAGLLKNPTWRQYPANMLRWRALGNALHVCCPDVLVGIYTPEELGANVNADGEIVDALPTQPAPRAQQQRSTPIQAEPVDDAVLVPETAANDPLATVDQLQAIKDYRLGERWKSDPTAFAQFTMGAVGRKFAKPAELTLHEASLVIEALDAVDVADAQAITDSETGADPFEAE